MLRARMNVVLLVGLLLAVVVGASRRTPGLVLPSGTEGVASLEEAAARRPDDAVAVNALARAFLERRAPGLALAVLERSPSVVRTSPEAADLAATAAMGAGRGRQALAWTRQALALCNEGSCGASLVVRATRREGLLEAALELGIEDIHAAPEAVEAAYRRTLRQVRIAMN